MKLDKMDLMICDMTDTSKYNLYYCDVHGIYAIRKDTDIERMGICAYCKKEGKRYEPGNA